jgi:PhnB protein
MAKLELAPYINFKGKAREAMELYQSIFGGELVLLTFNPDGPPKAANPGENIMHARLEADGLVIMGSDGSPEHPTTIGDNIAIALSGYPDDSEKISMFFDQLGQGGNVKQPLKEESWGTFGWLQDKYDINWMVNISKS